MENVHADYCEEGVAERLAARARREGRLVNVAGPEGRYEDVEDYDPVLRSHCRLDERNGSEKGAGRRPTPHS